MFIPYVTCVGQLSIFFQLLWVHDLMKWPLNKLPETEKNDEYKTVTFRAGKAFLSLGTFLPFASRLSCFTGRSCVTWKKTNSFLRVLWKQMCSLQTPMHQLTAIRWFRHLSDGSMDAKKLSPGLLFLPSIWQTSNIFWLRSDSCLMHSIINFDHIWWKMRLG